MTFSSMPIPSMLNPRYANSQICQFPDMSIPRYAKSQICQIPVESDFQITQFCASAEHTPGNHLSPGTGIPGDFEICPRGLPGDYQKCIFY